MPVFRLRSEARKYADTQKKGYRILKRNTQSERRREYLDSAIKSVKVVRVQRDGWLKPKFKVTSRRTASQQYRRTKRRAQPVQKPPRQQPIVGIDGFDNQAKEGVLWGEYDLP